MKRPHLFYYPEFGESLFQFLHLRESLNHIHADDFDIPTLRDEKRLGYDAMIQRASRSVFLQFKRATHRVRRVSRDPHSRTPPWYEFHIHTKEQHNLLVGLNALGRTKMRYAYYVAPLFSTKEELLKLAAVGHIRANSIAVIPRSVVSNDAHHYTYETKTDATFHSNGRFEVETLESADPVSAAQDAPQHSMRAFVETIHEITDTTLPNIEEAAFRSAVRILQRCSINWLVLYEQ